MRVEDEQTKETGRIEAFSDGVIAIAITLLVLDIRVPRELPEGARLLDALLAQWPSYFAFITSFATIGVMWMNHHRLFQLIRRTDEMLLVLNGVVLLSITVVPFPTALLAEYIGKPDVQTAAIVYCGCFVFMALCFNLLWRYASYKMRLLDPHSDPQAIRAISRQYAFGPLMYIIMFLVAFVSVEASLALNLALTLFFALSFRRARPAPASAAGQGDRRHARR